VGKILTDEELDLSKRIADLFNALDAEGYASLMESIKRRIDTSEPQDKEADMD